MAPLRCQFDIHNVRCENVGIHFWCIVIPVNFRFLLGKQGPPVHESVHPRGLAAGVGQEEEESTRAYREHGGAFHNLGWIVVGVHRSVSDDGGPRRQECFGNYLE